MQKFKNAIALMISENLPEEVDLDIEELIEVPPQREMGDYAFPCFQLARFLRKSPVKIAEELVEKLDKGKSIERIEQTQAYINFFIKKSALNSQVLDSIFEDADHYGSKNTGANKTVVIDFSSPNVAKPFNIGHLRSTVIGGSLKKIFEYLGYDVQGINYLGDYGTQFGKMIYAYKNWGQDVDLSHNPIKQLLDLYVRFHKEAEENPELDDKAREWFKKLEHKDPEALELWEKFH